MGPVWDAAIHFLCPKTQISIWYATTAGLNFTTRECVFFVFSSSKDGRVHILYSSVDSCGKAWSSVRIMKKIVLSPTPIDLSSLEHALTNLGNKCARARVWLCVCVRACARVYVRARARVCVCVYVCLCAYLKLSSHLFFCLPCLLPPFTVPCNMILARPDEWKYCPYHCSLCLFTIVRSLCGPVVCWVLEQTSLLVTWSLHKMRCIVSCGSTSFPWLVFFPGAPNSSKKGSCTVIKAFTVEPFFQGHFAWFPGWSPWWQILVTKHPSFRATFCETCSFLLPCTWTPDQGAPLL